VRCAATCPYGAGTFTEPNGTITIPADYASSVTCEYRITTGAPIFLRFDSFATEASYDTVTVYDGTSAFKPTRLGVFSGAIIPGIQYAASGSIFLRFQSDSSDAAGGVTIAWSTYMATLAPTTLAPTTTRNPAALARTRPLVANSVRSEC
jgi:hypothetical protein